MNISIEDDYLEEEYFNKLVEEFLKPITPYYFCNGVSYENDGYTQFVHGIFSNGEVISSIFGELLTPFFTKLGAKSIQQCKMNFLQRTDKPIEHGWHVDMNVGINEIPEDKKQYVKSSVFYLNTNNGYTSFKTGATVTSKANRIVTFPYNLEHQGSTNTCEEMYRLVLVTNYITADDYP